jgi:hypothetical protein
MPHGSTAFSLKSRMEGHGTNPEQRLKTLQALIFRVKPVNMDLWKMWVNI